MTPFVLAHKPPIEGIQRFVALLESRADPDRIIRVHLSVLALELERSEREVLSLLAGASDAGLLSVNFIPDREDTLHLVFHGGKQ